ncbi:hypothetical protein IV203_036893 [Nitzschia inconspicua]|uniref:Uncharacterized protein n=1 Tax=Nitzschia inconspicua TaxID=303405 RepID=A0A9K3LGP8_9STRA|nr:hypothetical protein IV203_036893 [Nitzschia inconspicua]
MRRLSITNGAPRMSFGIDPRKKDNLKQTIIDQRIKISFGRAISRDLCEEERTRSATRFAVLLTSYIGEEENNHSVEIQKKFLDMVMVYFHPDPSIQSLKVMVHFHPSHSIPSLTNLLDF